MSIRVRVPPRDRSEVRFGCSPALEAILSLSLLIQPRHHPLHHEWARLTRRRLPREMKQGLADFRFRHMDYIPAGLLPAPDRPTLAFAEDLERIRALPLPQQSNSILRNLTGAPPETWDRLGEPEVRSGLLERAAELGSPTVGLVRLGLQRPQELVDRFLDVVERYWELIFAERWEELRPQLERANEQGRGLVAGGGLDAMLLSLRPRVGFDRSRREFQIRRTHDQTITLPDQAELTFVPSAYLWPHIGLVAERPGKLAVLHSPPFAAFESSDQSGGEVLLPLLRALGDKTRLQTLRLVAERPRSTQELAALIGLSEPAISKHLHQLAAVGVVEARRDGYYRLYSLSRERVAPLSAMLLDYLEAGKPPAHPDEPPL